MQLWFPLITEVKTLCVPQLSQSICKENTQTSDYKQRTCTHRIFLTDKTYPQIHHHDDWTTEGFPLQHRNRLLLYFKHNLCDLQTAYPLVTSSPSQSVCANFFLDWVDASDPFFFPLTSLSSSLLLLCKILLSHHFSVSVYFSMRKWFNVCVCVTEREGEREPND